MIYGTSFITIVSLLRSESKILYLLCMRNIIDQIYTSKKKNTTRECKVSSLFHYTCNL